MKKICTPFDAKTIKSLRAGDEVLLSGIIYPARDQAHLKLTELLKEKKKLPVDLEGKVVYYCGPTPARPGAVIGSCGPTTSNRMDEFTPGLLKQGLKAMIGKGARSRKVVEAIKKNRAVYFIAPAGAGAYLSEKVVNSRLAAFADLGPEAIYELEVRDFPLVVCIDSGGKSIYS